jgi:hypothetical protein
MCHTLGREPRADCLSFNWQYICSMRFALGYSRGARWRERQLVGKLWSFLVTHFKDAWNAIVQWFQRPHRMTLVGAVVFLMLALVLSSALVVDNLFIGSVRRDPTLDTLFQWTAYVSQSTVIVFMAAFAFAGLCLLYANVRVSMARKRVQTLKAEKSAAVQEAIIDVVNAAGAMAGELAGGMESGKYSPEVAVPLIDVVHAIIKSHELAPSDANGTLQLGPSERDNRGGGLSLPAPKPMPSADELSPADAGEDA